MLSFEIYVSFSCSIPFTKNPIFCCYENVVYEFAIQSLNVL